MCQRRGEELNTQHRHILVCKCTSKSAENWGTSWEWPMHAYTHLQLANLQQTRTFKACATWGIENCKERRHAMTCSNTKNTWWSRVHYWQPLTHDARHKVPTRSRFMIYPRQITLMEFMTSYFATMYAECGMLNHKKHKWASWTMSQRALVSAYKHHWWSCLTRPQHTLLTQQHECIAHDKSDHWA